MTRYKKIDLSIMMPQRIGNPASILGKTARGLQNENKFAPPLSEALYRIPNSIIRTKSNSPLVEEAVSAEFTFNV